MSSREIQKDVSGFYDERGAKAMSGPNDPESIFLPLHIREPYEDSYKALSNPFGEKQVLELGCGTGKATVRLAMQGWTVTGVDMSPVSIEAAKALARHRGMEGRCQFVQSSIENFVNNNSKKYDAVYAAGVLYYLNEEARNNLVSKLLRSNGKFVFVEPLGNNPLLNLYRRWRGNRDERSLTSLMTVKDVKIFARQFAATKVQYYDVLTLGGVIFGYGIAGRIFHQTAVLLDRILLRIPLINRLSFKVLFVGENRV